MKSKLKIFVAVIVIVGSALSLGVKFWADGEKLAAEGPSLMKLTPSNSLSVMIDNSIYIFDKYNTEEVIDLKTLNIDSHGDYAFFSNGDLLVYNSENKPSILDNLARFFRLKEERQLPPKGKNGLYRCNLSQQSCKLFSKELPEFYSSFHLLIDTKLDDIYIADGQRFTLYKLDSSGKLLAKNNSELKFPNKILLHEDRLYIANTNYHEIKVVSSETENFGEKLDSHKAVVDGIHRWPSAMTSAGESWWVLIANGGMKNAKINVYNDHWNQIERPLLSINTDPIDIETYDDKIWVTDWTNYGIYRFSLEGERIANFSNPEFDNAFSQWKEQTDYYKSLSRRGLISFVALLILGFIAALILEKKKSSNAKPESGSTKGYFNNLANSAFKDNPDGNGWLYYPNGVLSKGRIVVDKHYKEKLFKYQKYTYISALALVVVYGLILDPTHLSIYKIFSVVILTIALFSSQYWFTKDLPVSAVKLKYKEAVSIAAQGLPDWYFKLLYAASGLVLILGLCAPLIINKPYSELSNIALITMGLGVVGIILGRFIQKLKMSYKSNDLEID